MLWNFQDNFVIAPGVFNPFSALLAKRANFKAIYLSGGGLTSSLGLPDLGVITLDEITWMLRRITDVVNLPIIVDADTGFGEALNVYRAVKVLEKAGATAIHIEDQVMPKKCGHLQGKEVISTKEMIAKIKAALMARKELMIIARIDSRGVMGLRDAIERGKAYVDAGADVIFPEALESKEEFLQFRKEIGSDVKLMANMTEFGKTPLITAEEFKSMGYNVVIFPVTAFRVAAKAMEEAYNAIAKDGSQRSLMGKMMTRREQYDVINYDFYEDLDSSMAKGL
ncbi:methylisocitrate lyase [Sulfuracidifex metallicus]|uniref:Methylisocitrate lyase n=1 Tax=Sulfuracidifex metallicus DSM 6482 = JCM 9184 TaxID=523847 RepID=A0A6A9QL51_SULME|nr:methylisocitrate lyase [Sulfuracidifex metallicus]MUN29010.1 methylisocitrate lyase [Sulfuracidifex metallicus DSM 6482 = JCM 9184]WOE50480.1 methylisocitrate lyase [Sulfuracidifex metallicus DSM 6482 = JCM 9184]